MCRQTVETLMRRAGLQGVSGRPKHRKIRDTPTASDLVDRDFARVEPDRLWVTDITEHATREGKVCCAVVLDTFSRRVVGWSIDSRAAASLVTNALGMAIEGRNPTADETVIHSGQGTQFTSWAFTQRAADSGLLPSMGSVGDCFDNAMIESFWSRTQVELLDRKRWHTRIELANAIFEYLEIWHNRQRRHTSLGMLTPVEFENRHQHKPAARIQQSAYTKHRDPHSLHKTQGESSLLMRPAPPTRQSHTQTRSAGLGRPRGLLTRPS